MAVDTTVSYGTNTESDTYWTARGNTDWTGLTEAEQDINLIKAMDYLDRTFRWRGNKATQDQDLEWPRLQAYDDDDYLISGIPEKVKQAQFIIADLYRAGVIDLEGIVTEDSASIRRQKVDVIEVEYDTARRLNGPAVVSHVFKLLAPYTLGDRLLRA